jgi:hypothetical protein
MSVPAIFNRAQSEPPNSDGPWASVEKLFVRVMARLTAVEALATKVAALEKVEMPAAVKGDDGRGVSSVRLNAAAELIFTLTDATEMNVGVVRPTQVEPPPIVQTVERVVEGSPGVGIVAAALNAVGELCITLTDDRVLNVGAVRPEVSAPTVQTVERIIEGPPGVGVSGATLNAAGELCLALTDGRVLNVGRVRADAPEPRPPIVQTVERVIEGRPGVGIVAASLNAVGELVLTLSDDRVLNVGLVKAKDGEPGKNADPVVSPENGVGISNGTVDDRGHLILALTDGKSIDAGRVRGEDGNSPDPIEPPQNGVGIAAASVNAEGELVLSLSNGHTLNVGRVVGRDGDDAERFERPQDGVGVANAVQNEDGELLLVLSDGRTLNVGRVRAKDGEPGEDADPAEPGVSVKAAVINDAGHLVLSLTNGSEVDAGLAVKQGEPGESIKGEKGIGVAKAEISGVNLVLHMTDGTKQTVGRVVGKDGETKVIEPPPLPSIPEIEIGDTFRANVTAKDLDRLMLREITVNGETIQVLALN